MVASSAPYLTCYLLACALVALPRPAWCFDPPPAQKPVPPTLFVGGRLTVGGNLTIGPTKEDIRQAIEDTAATVVTQLAHNSDLSEKSIRTIFRQVVANADDTTPIATQVEMILQSWKDLKDRLDRITSHDSHIQALRVRALEALNAGDRDGAENLLNEARTSMLESAQKLQEELRQQLSDVAETDVDLAKISLTKLRFSEAAVRYRDAAVKAPDNQPQRKCELLLDAVDAALEAGDYGSAEQDAARGLGLSEADPTKLLVCAFEMKHRQGRIFEVKGDPSRSKETLLQAQALLELVPQLIDGVYKADLLEDVAAADWSLSDFADTIQSLVTAEKLTDGDATQRGQYINSEAYNTHGGALVELGDFKPAETALLQAYQIRLTLFHAQSLAPRLIDSMNNLGNLYRHTGDYDKADSFLARAETSARLVYGPKHTTLAVILVNESVAACDRGDQAKALKAINEAIDIRHDRLEPDSILTAYALAVKGIILLRQGDLNDADSALRESYAVRSRRLRDPNLILGKAHLGLSALQFARGDTTGAVREAKSAFATISHFLPPDHPLARLAAERLSQAQHTPKNGATVPSTGSGPPSFASACDL